MRLTHAFVLVFCVFLASSTLGCSAIGLGDGKLGFGEFAEKLKAVTVADLDAATARAIAGGDTIAAQCYPVLKKYVEQGASGEDKVVGLFDAFEKSRLAAKKINSQVPEDLQIACAPLFVDQQVLMARIAAMVR